MDFDHKSPAVFCLMRALLISFGQREIRVQQGNTGLGKIALVKIFNLIYLLDSNLASPMASSLEI